MLIFTEVDFEESFNDTEHTFQVDEFKILVEELADYDYDPELDFNYNGSDQFITNQGPKLIPQFDIYTAANTSDHKLLSSTLSFADSRRQSKDLNDSYKRITTLLNESRFHYSVTTCMGKTTVYCYPNEYKEKRRELVGTANSLAGTLRPLYDHILPCKKVGFEPKLSIGRSPLHQCILAKIVQKEYEKSCEHSHKLKYEGIQRYLKTKRHYIDDIE